MIRSKRAILKRGRTLAACLVFLLLIGCSITMYSQLKILDLVSGASTNQSKIRVDQEHVTSLTARLRQEFRAAVRRRANLDDTKFTMMIPSFGRPSILQHNLDIVANGAVPSLAEVVVTWVSPEAQGPVPDYLLDRKWAIPVKFIESPGRDLNSRFIPQEPLTTRCIYSADDDLIVPPAAIEFAFQTWRMTTAPIVGFNARARIIDEYDDWRYEVDNKTIPYAMILTNAAFLDVALLDVYNGDLNEAPRVMVQEWLNCEDILLNFVGTTIKQLPPLLVNPSQGHIIHYRLGVGKGRAISRTHGHLANRHKCMREFRKIFGDESLLPHSRSVQESVSRMKVVENGVFEEGEKE